MGVQVERSNGLGTAAMVCGICAVVLSFIPIIGFSAWALGPLAIIFGAVAARREQVPKGGAIAGIVTGIVSLVICFIWLAVFVAAVDETNRNLKSPKPAASSAQAQADRLEREVDKIDRNAADHVAAPSSGAFDNFKEKLESRGEGSWSSQPRTVPAGAITLAEFNQLQKGMTYNQVVSIIGGPGQMSIDMDMGGPTLQAYEWKGADGIASAQLQFHNGTLQSLIQLGLD